LGKVRESDFQRLRCFCKAWSGLRLLNFTVQSREWPENLPCFRGMLANHGWDMNREVSF
jgi:hypothetical protein